ncbi:MAG: M1 family metallopeptidase [Candidatus Kariarchaeaceae archaeon]|jgi:tricorn protease interacting factor F2/3
MDPVHYSLYLNPNLKTFTFEGKTTLFCTIDNFATELVLNVLDLEVDTCQVKVNGDFQDAQFSVSLEEQELRVQLPKSGIRQVELQVIYRGKINEKLAGMYRSGYTINGEKNYMAVTQFQESDARRAFPCIDVPGKKATFDVEIEVSENQIAISNEAVKQETILETGRKVVQFIRTPKMSTYLVFFGVGDFEFIEESFNEINVRLLASPGNATKYGAYGLDFGIKSLKYCIEYYGIEYPLSKMDLIATADFAMGAMENWGAILFRENLLLHYPGITSKSGETRIEEVIAHEVAHQWFGNLVSPSSWKYLWLNESFATFFGFGIIDNYYPEKYVWEYFLQTETSVALIADAFLETSAIEIPGDAAVGMTIKNAPILYNKGGSILRMIESYLGKDAFREGLRIFLRKHAYDIAKSDDLWSALESVTGQPIINLMEGWVLQDGYPLMLSSNHCGTRR